ncbi:MAG: hypothetical protein IJ130_11830, partial [Solobacterium sp.]|nr:hypothetical protein [Solobacterium sp.]
MKKHLSVLLAFIMAVSMIVSSAGSVSVRADETEGTPSSDIAALNVSQADEANLSAASGSDSLSLSETEETETLDAKAAAAEEISGSETAAENASESEAVSAAEDVSGSEVASTEDVSGSEAAAEAEDEIVQEEAALSDAAKPAEVMENPAQSAELQTDEAGERGVPSEVNVHSVQNTLPDLPDSGALTEGYVNEKFGISSTSSSGMLKARRANQGSKLEGANAAAYQILSSHILAVADGAETSTSFDLSCADLGITVEYYTAEDLGLDWLFDEYGEANPEALNIMYEMAGLDIAAVVNAIAADHPYALYWFDKTAGYSHSAYGSGSYSNGEEFICMPDPCNISFAVSADYAPGGMTGSYETDSQQTGRASAAAANAQQIISDYSGLSDYEKIVAYKDEICAYVSYNDAAARNSSTAYGDPWQMVYVFDGDDSTNVVCEGYSKAFQYLCDESSFSSSITCNSVTGTMSGGTGAGGHMWNLVSIGGENYLADITNSDQDSVGSDGELFMAGYTGEEDSAYSYTISCGSQSVSYVYDEDTTALYSESERRLASAAFDPGKTPEPVPAQTPTPTPEPTTEPEIPGSTIETAIPLALGDTAIVSITGPDYDAIHFAFTPEEDGDDIFTSTAPQSGYAFGSVFQTNDEFYNEFQAEIGEGYSVNLYLTGGETYYLKSGAADMSEDVSYQVTVEKENEEIKPLYAYAHQQHNYANPGEEVTFVVDVSADERSELTYRWMKGYEDIPGSGNQDTFTITAGNENVTYICEVTDQFGNMSRASFYVRIKNGLDVRSAGGQSDYYVSEGEEVTLGVLIYADDMEGITTKWYQDSLAMEGMDNKTEITVTVNEHHDYTCWVTDKFGNVKTPVFNTYVENHLDVQREQDENLSVSQGEQVTLSIAVTADDTSDLQFRWYRVTDTFEDLEDVTGPSLTEEINSYRSYYCTVEDKYGNSKELWWSVEIENQLEASAAGGQTELYVNAGQTVDLEVVASAADMDGITYEWHNIDNSANGNHYTFTAERNEFIYCDVLDKYNNRRQIHFHIYIDNHFEAYADESRTSDTVTISANKGDPVSLQVYASADDTENMKYEWHGAGGDSYYYPNTDCLTITADRAVNYYCRVSDRFNNYKDIHFNIEVYNGLEASAVQDYFGASPGDEVVLEVVASAENQEDLSFTWFNESGELFENPDNLNTLTITADRTESYYCEVRDSFGNIRNVYFYIQIDNQLNVEANVPMMDGVAQIYVMEGDDAELSVEASCAEGDVSYSWRYIDEENDWEEKQISENNSLSLENIQKDSHYKVYVTDQYGNSQVISFQVHVATELSVLPEVNLRILPGESTTLTVNPVTPDQETPLIYEWSYYDEDEDETFPLSETGPSLVVSPSQYTEYYCNITQGDNQVRERFNVEVSSGLYVNTSDYMIEANSGDKVTLSVYAETEMPPLRYEWYRDAVSEET